MKKSIFAVTAMVISATTAMAQAPEAFSYSGIARNNAQVVSNTTIGLQLSIMQGTPTGTAVYTETQSTTTDTAGYFAVAVGNGTATSGTFGSINWANGNHYLKVSADFNGGTNYTDIGTTQLLSVPYALYAKNAGAVTTIDSLVGFYLGIDSNQINNNAGTNWRANVEIKKATNGYIVYAASNSGSAYYYYKVDANGIGTPLSNDNTPQVTYSGQLTITNGVATAFRFGEIINGTFHPKAYLNLVKQ